ncbi:hypothetical protein [Fumia xinanensis]|uniref:Foldase protein PrsA n=1 Tax=Fumia xinanensis TaxID=2763659 RepID=A0A926E573_9FIRM|nr:hypothetical protein [Fumia xinanensis]MBC8559735.1 hypothetical protein [Fumia xinanensis]PWL41235.1 MAG: hypothetical protein DBY45_10495 [Clostridiales bacterium]
MNLFKKITAGLLAAATLVSFAGCSGSDTTWTYKLGDYTVTSGMYVGLSLTAYQEAQALEGFDASKTPFDQELEGEDGLKWVTDEAESLAKRYLAVEQKFDEMGLTVDEESQKAMDANAEAYYEYLDKIYGYADKGFGLESYKKLQLNQYKSNSIFNMTYGEGGSEEVKDDELKDIFYSDYAKVFYIPVNITETDEKGEQKNRDQADIDADIEMLTKRLENGDDFQAILDDYFSGEETKPTASQFMAIVQKGDLQTPQSILDFAFDSKIGEVGKSIDSTGSFVLKKMDITESEEDFTNNRSNLLSTLKSEEFNAKIDEWSNAIEPEKNEKALSKHSPKNIKIKPTGTSSSSSESSVESSESSEESSENSSEGTESSTD